MKKILSTIYLFAGLGVLFLVPIVANATNTEAVEVARLRLDAETITKGYTVESPEKDLKVGVVNNAVTVPVEVVLKKIPVSHFPEDSKTTRVVSDILEYDIRQSTDSGTESLGVLEKPVYIAIKYDSDTTNKKVVHYWNKPTGEWVPLPTTTDFKNKLARAVSHLPYSRLAVFDDEYVYEGPASWYVSGYHCDCAASQVYLRKTKLKVTNITSTSPKYGKSMIVRVNDYGPDPAVHPDRPIDLDKVAFKQLAMSVGSGLMLVRIEPVDINNAPKYSWVIEEEKRRLAEAEESNKEKNKDIVSNKDDGDRTVEADDYDVETGVEVQKSEIKFKNTVELVQTKSEEEEI